MYFNCAGCGKRVSIEEIERGDAVNSGGRLYCAGCAAKLPASEAKVKVEEKSAVKVQGELKCARCGREVLPEQLSSGSAVKTGEGKVYCVECVAAGMPLFEALTKVGSLSSEDSHDIPVVTPAVEATPIQRSIARERDISGRPSSGAPLVLVFIGLILLVIIILLASGTGSSPSSGTQTSIGTQPSGGSNTSPIRESYEETTKVMTQLAGLKQRWSAKPDEYEQILGELNALLTLSLSPDVRESVESFKASMVEEREQLARRNYDVIVAEMRRLAGEGRYEEASREADKFPLHLQSAGDWWARLRAEANSYATAKSLSVEYEKVKVKTEGLLKEEKFEDALSLLKGFAEKAEGTLFTEKVKEEIARISRMKDESNKKRLSGEWAVLQKEIEVLIAKKDFESALKKIDEFAAKSGGFLKEEYEPKRERVEALAKEARINREKKRWTESQAEIDGLLNSKRYAEAMKKVEEFLRSEATDVAVLAAEKANLVWKRAYVAAEQLISTKRFEEAQKIVEPFAESSMQTVALEAQNLLRRIEELKTASKPPDRIPGGGQDEEAGESVAEAKLELLKVEQKGEMKQNIYRISVSRPEGSKKVVIYKLLSKARVEASLQKKVEHPLYLLELPDCSEIESIIAEIEVNNADKQYLRLAWLDID
ncbi:MAG: hypothetical protein N2234_02365, partial [Planctomycetota bacterium]|nr:hypothetical protein [Planctomycetota bacterium]